MFTEFLFCFCLFVFFHRFDGGARALGTHRNGGFTGLYWVLLGFTGFYWVVLSFEGLIFVSFVLDFSM